ncbi:hypothetical protein X474_03385 [Dethiosulfatarculus sandiegensis]|uniref:DUF1468 domain-containing protein n=1 Tax=Dethiosulfatarculus sandiegensis TaxID=1429043 RepID=A0A0D2K102_9BACT|nr:hypothetical protein X474_03385 [Dethiosulfatarculus sandiegensis]
MAKTDLVGGSVIALLGCFLIQQSLALEYWLSDGPGPGFLPVWAGVLILSGGLMQAFLGYKKARTEKGQRQKGESGNPLLLSIIIGLIIVSILAMSYLGFCISMFVLVGSLVFLTRKHTLKICLITAFCTTLGFYTLFKYLLSIPLPKGIIGF